MKNFKYPILFIGLLFTIFCQSQNIIEGTVNDTLGNPLSQISLVLKSETTGAVLGFDYSNDSGYYRVAFNAHGPLKIIASALSYEKKEISLVADSLSKKNTIIQNFVLSDKTTLLDEVIVNADKPIITKKDTISIKVESFLDGSEEVVEDILEKLPGVEVTKDGTVMVQGKSVEKVMVEGDDLFEKGYKLLTKNLNAGVIDKVEILEHYSDNILLKNIEDSDKIALNLTLKEDRKTTLFGNISNAYGTDNFYEQKTNLISFNKKSKYYFFGNLNNVGSDAIGDIYQIIYPDIFSEATYVGDGVSGFNLVNLFAGPPNLEESKYNFNNAELASLNGIYNLNKKSKIKTLLFFTSDERKFNSSSIEQFNLPPTTFTNTENYGLRKNGYAISGKLDGLFTLGKNSQIEYIGRYSKGDYDENSTLVFNDISINEELKSKSEFTDHRITFTNRFNEFSAIQVTGRYIYDFKPQDFDVNNFVFEELFPENDSIEMLGQNSLHKLNFSGLEGKFLFNKKKSNLSLKLGYTGKYNNLNSQLTLIDNQGQNFGTDPSFNNSFQYDVTDIYLKSNYIYAIKNISLRSSLEFHQLLVNSNGSKTNPFVIVPGLGFSWNINKNNKFLGSYKYSSKNIPLDALYNNFTLTGYRSLQRGVGDFQLLRGNFFLASYIFGNWSDSFLINASLLYNSDEKYVSNNSVINSDFLQSSSLILNDRAFYSANLSFDNYFEKLSANLKFKLAITSNQVENIVNQSELRTINTSTFNYGAEYRSVFLGPLNFHLGTSWVETVINTFGKSKNLNNTSFFDLNFKFNEKLSIKLKNERYYFGNIANENTFWFTDVMAYYTIKKNKYKLTFHANNILNTDSFSNFSINDTGSYRSEYELLPRYYLVKFEFRF